MSAAPALGPGLALAGVHHVTALTADAQANVDFYVGRLGLSLVKRTVMQTQRPGPGVLHLFHGDRAGRPGSVITFFVHRRLPRGRAGAGMVSRIIWRLGSAAALDFWEERLAGAGAGVGAGAGAGAGVVYRREAGALFLSDPDGLEHELRCVDDPTAEPGPTWHPEIPPEYALGGIGGVAAHLGADAGTGLDALLGFAADGQLIGAAPAARFVTEAPPAAPPRRGAGTVHHVAWTIADDAFDPWRQRLESAGVELVEVADRFYFRSLYFHIPGGVLFELATAGPGFGIDEAPDALGTSLSLPPAWRSRRAEYERSLPRIVDPQRSAARPG